MTVLHITLLLLSFIHVVLPVPVLIPSQAAFGSDVAGNDGEPQHIFKIDGNRLGASTKYGARVSFLSTNPASFDLNLVKASGDDKHGRELSPSTIVGSYLRRVLNTEQLVFSVDASKKIVLPTQETVQEALLLVEVTRRGVRPSTREQKDREEVRFHIVIEPLTFGVVPHDVSKMVAFVVFAIICTGYVVVPRLRKLLLSIDATTPLAGKHDE